MARSTSAARPGMVASSFLIGITIDRSGRLSFIAQANPQTVIEARAQVQPFADVLVAAHTAIFLPTVDDLHAAPAFFADAEQRVEPGVLGQFVELAHFRF